MLENIFEKKWAKWEGYYFNFRQINLRDPLNTRNTLKSFRVFSRVHEQNSNGTKQSYSGFTIPSFSILYRIVPSEICSTRAACD